MQNKECSHTVPCQMFKSYHNLAVCAKCISQIGKIYLFKLQNVFFQIVNCIPNTKWRMFTYCPAVRCCDLITILTSCLRSFSAVKAFRRKLKARWQSEENQIEIVEYYWGNHQIKEFTSKLQWSCSPLQYWTFVLLLIIFIKHFFFTLCGWYHCTLDARSHKKHFLHNTFPLLWQR